MTMKELAERCERTTGDDATALVYLEMDICAALGIEMEGHERPFVSSLDAAMTLVPEGWDFRLQRDYRGIRAIVWRPQRNVGFDAEAATLPLALTAAALRAIASQETTR